MHQSQLDAIPYSKFLDCRPKVKLTDTEKTEIGTWDLGPETWILYWETFPSWSQTGTTEEAVEAGLEEELEALVQDSGTHI